MRGRDLDIGTLFSQSSVRAQFLVGGFRRDAGSAIGACSVHAPCSLSRWAARCPTARGGGSVALSPGGDTRPHRDQFQNGRDQ